MARVAVDINQLNRAIIMVGSRAELANSLGKAPSYISYVISSGEMEEEEAEHIAKKFNIDVIVGDTRVLGTEVVPKTKPIKLNSIWYDHGNIGEFIEKFCEIGNTKALLNDLFVVYILYAHSFNSFGLSRPPFFDTLLKLLPLTYDKEKISEPFDYIPNLINDVSDHYLTLKRIVIKGITLKKSEVIEVLKTEFITWIDEKCEYFDGETDLEELRKSYNGFYSDKVDLTISDFKAVLTFLGFSMACGFNQNNSTRCRGLKLKNDHKKKAVVDDLYGLKKDDLVLGEINPNPPMQGLFEQMIEEQKKTNRLLEELINIWR